MSDWATASAALWPALTAAGIHIEASTVQPGHTTPTTFFVNFERADVNPITGMMSTDYEMEYVHAEVPTLKEGAEVIVAGILYRVRQEPEVKAEHGLDGTYRCAYLTRVATACD